MFEGKATHSVPVGAVGDGLDGAGQHNAALIAVCRTLPVLHDLPRQTHDTVLTSNMLKTQPTPTFPALVTSPSMYMFTAHSHLYTR